MTNIKRHLRGTWISTVINLDWPSKNSLSLVDPQARINQQKNELKNLLDEAVKLRLNAVFFQVKPACDAFYRSQVLPWSAYLTGTFGQDPGYDPLQFAIEQAHLRNLELHAWFNPYRVSMNTRQSTVEALSNVPPASPVSVYSSNPDWVRIAAQRFVLDPGVPEARDWVIQGIMEVVDNYDIDGVHLDDYFYYETPDSPLDDADTFAKYGNAFQDKGDWRRNNITEMIALLSRRIRASKSHVKFGVSPAGVWRNQRDDIEGSDTTAGSPTYDKQFADTRQWVLDELLDYIAPQVYWPLTRRIVQYDIISNWWASVVRGKSVHLYIGMALYKVGVASSAEPQWLVENGTTEIGSQLLWNLTSEGVHGSVLFRASFFHAPAVLPATGVIKQSIWPTLALVPSMPWKGTKSPAPPIEPECRTASQGVELRWVDGNDEGTVYYAIYRFACNQSVMIDNPENLIATVRSAGTQQCWVDTSPSSSEGMMYAVTALDRNHNESVMALARWSALVPQQSE
ncbi:glycoside hydrolase family 10 protein [Pseudomonas sp. NR3]|uniref:glycoside hydrolase family 10 protein n=1 Tax=Pseudomonas sp. NR3 TaxID=3155978 RepID=UPI003B670E05